MKTVKVNFKKPCRVQIKPERWYSKPFQKKSHFIAYAAGGELFAKYLTNEDLKMIYLTGIVIVKPSWGSELIILGD